MSFSFILFILVILLLVYLYRCCFCRRVINQVGYGILTPYHYKRDEKDLMLLALKILDDRFSRFDGAHQRYVSQVSSRHFNGIVDWQQVLGARVGYIKAIELIGRHLATLANGMEFMSGADIICEFAQMEILVLNIVAKRKNDLMNRMGESGRETVTNHQEAIKAWERFGKKIKSKVTRFPGRLGPESG